jgi:hypothetical protein
MSRFLLPTSISSRRASVASHANSSYSLAGSTRHILSDGNGPLEPPSAPFSANPGTRASSTSSGDVSLTVNYFPTKFSSSMLGGTARKRKGKKGEDDVLDQVMPKHGGGVEAFKSGEARIPGEADDDEDDEDGVTGGWFGAKTGKSTPKKLRWNKFKWILFCANILVRSFQFPVLIVG